MQIIGLCGRLKLMRLLTIVGVACELMVEQPRNHPGADYCFDRWHSHPPFAAALARGLDDRMCSELGLEDAPHRLRPLRKTVSRNVELGCIEGGEVHHGDVHVAFCVYELGAQRIGKSPQRALRAAIRRLQRYRPVSERGADLHYGP